MINISPSVLVLNAMKSTIITGNSKQTRFSNQETVIEPILSIAYSAIEMIPTFLGLYDASQDEVLARKGESDFNTNIQFLSGLVHKTNTHAYLLESQRQVASLAFCIGVICGVGAFPSSSVLINLTDDESDREISQRVNGYLAEIHTIESRSGQSSLKALINKLDELGADHKNIQADVWGKMNQFRYSGSDFQANTYELSLRNLIEKTYAYAFTLAYGYSLAYTHAALQIQARASE